MTQLDLRVWEFFGHFIPTLICLNSSEEGPGEKKKKRLNSKLSNKGAWPSAKYVQLYIYDDSPIPVQPYLPTEFTE